MRVRERIVEELKSGVQMKAQIIDSVAEKESVTVQAVYKELRKLKKEEIVLDKSKRLSLTLSYIEGEYKEWKDTRQYYTDKISIEELLRVPKGKSRNFIFYNIVDLDLYWTQMFVILERVLSEDTCRYSILAHDWFTYARPSTDYMWVNSTGRKYRMIVTHPTEIDWKMARLRRRQGYEFTGGENPLKLNESQYCTIVGDWVFEVQFDEHVAKTLNSYIRSIGKVEEVNKKRMQEIMKMSGKFKLRLSNSPQKAKQATDKINKYFK